MRGLTALVVLLVCCGPSAPLDSSSGGSGDATGGTVGDSSGAETASSSGGPGGSAGSTAGGTGAGTGPTPPDLPPSSCVQPWSWTPAPPDDACEWTCESDQDGDGSALPCDNAPEIYNPDQQDQDGDGFGDVFDLCPIVADASWSADSDKDGVGNTCDRCRRQLNDYLWDLPGGIPGYLLPRNNPDQRDTDQDGIGDACDNCVRTANCESFGPNNPYVTGGPIGYDDDTACQVDADNNGIGDACQGAAPLPGAAGPVGYGDDDDLDQDGLSNILDGCPRLAVDPVACATDSDCGPDRSCTNGVCNHADPDGDQVGSDCDTCPLAANPLQRMDGGAQEDDPDGDFVGVACEPTQNCAQRSDNRWKLMFYDVVVDGRCCTTSYPGDDVLHDLDGVPIRIDCAEDDQANDECRPVPSAAWDLPGYMELPAGCEDALAAANKDEASEVTLAEAGSIAALWDHACIVPPPDHDADGVPDRCDHCPSAWDPLDVTDIDDHGWWPPFGVACNLDHGLEPCCANWEGG